MEHSYTVLSVYMHTSYICECVCVSLVRTVWFN